ncbi:MAG: metal-dependent hydrolase with the TIM-barrel fold protein, partial [Clostridia bacterium]|nr:metal-dependent hydrolase with the TIM-barrel fold protein [Clostridia bacterium]
TFDEKDRGSLEEGKIADMVILSANPYTVPAEELINLKVEKLILSGEDYKPQSQSVMSVITKGIKRHGVRL